MRKTALNMNWLLLSIFLSMLLFQFVAAEDNLISRLHANAPQPCVAKSTDDRSSGIAIFPQGKSDEELRGIMGGIASIFLSQGAPLMAPNNTVAVYTAVFYEENPINEIGIYAYKFADPIKPDMFTAKEELNGKIFVIDNQLLVLLWHEDYVKTARCFNAIKDSLTATQ